MKLDDSAYNELWNLLPNDLIVMILVHASRARRVEMVQRVWRGYRARILLGRFRMLQYLRPFRWWNPSVHAFMERARL